MVGLSIEHNRGTRMGALARGVIGDFHALTDADASHLSDEARQKWSRDRLSERIDQEIAALQEHRATIDLEAFELDRAEAGERARFDTSPEAKLARRYAADAQRNYFKALNEFRRVEAESLARAEADPIPPTTLEAIDAPGSTREMDEPEPTEPVEEPFEPRWTPMTFEKVAKTGPMTPDRGPSDPE
jgi:hypothetical protein